jgi:Ni/Fe-hydrogenase 1 B-type cytochrome subunit
VSVAVPRRRYAPRATLPAHMIERTYVWDAVVRLTHFLIAMSIVVLSITGIYIGNPFIHVSGEAGTRFVMGWIKAIHFYGAIVFTLSVLARIVWMFTGPRYARWSSFIPVTRERWRELWGTLEFYLFVLRKPPAAKGHNPVAGLAYSFVFGLYLVMIATGLGLYSIGADIGSPLRAFGAVLPYFGGASGAQWIHHVVMWLLIGFAVHHVYSAVLVSLVEKNGEIDSIVSGYKWVEPEQRK